MYVYVNASVYVNVYINVGVEVNEKCKYMSIKYKMNVNLVSILCKLNSN